MSIEVEVGGVYEEAADLTPAGAVIAFAGVNAPSGWLLCDGRAVSRVTYSRLFEAIGFNFGKGDESTTFNLPDLQGYFIRGLDNGTGNDPDASSRTASATGGSSGDNVGSKQDSAMWGHKHRNSSLTLYQTNSSAGGGVHLLQNVYGGSADYTYEATLSTHGTPNLSSESRPKNIAMNYIIKI